MLCKIHSNTRITYLLLIGKLVFSSTPVDKSFQKAGSEAHKPEIEKSISIQHPSSPVLWRPGTSQIIKWKASLEAGDSVKIYLDNGEKSFYLTKANSGIVHFYLPGWAREGKYVLTIRSQKMPGVSDSCDGIYLINRNLSLLGDVSISCPFDNRSLDSLDKLLEWDLSRFSLEILPVNDNRKNEHLIGRKYFDKSPACAPAFTYTSIAEWATVNMHYLLYNKFNLKKNNGEKRLRVMPSIQELMVEEKESYVGMVVILFKVFDDNGRLIWEGAPLGRYWYSASEYAAQAFRIGLCGAFFDCVKRFVTDANLTKILHNMADSTSAVSSQISDSEDCINPALKLVSQANGSFILKNQDSHVSTSKRIMDKKSLITGSWMFGISWGLALMATRAIAKENCVGCRDVSQVLWIPMAGPILAKVVNTPKGFGTPTVLDISWSLIQTAGFIYMVKGLIGKKPVFLNPASGITFIPYVAPDRLVLSVYSDF